SPPLGIRLGHTGNPRKLSAVALACGRYHGALSMKPKRVTIEMTMTDVSQSKHWSDKCRETMCVPVSRPQTTSYIYGVTTNGSGINSNDILLKVQYPNTSTNGSGLGNPGTSSAFV